jgi:hypothetical protein
MKRKRIHFFTRDFKSRHVIPKEAGMKRVIFAFIVNGYDTLKDRTTVTPGWDYLCLSEQGLRSEVWHAIRSTRWSPYDE